MLIVNLVYRLGSGHPWPVNIELPNVHVPMLPPMTSFVDISERVDKLVERFAPFCVEHILVPTDASENITLVSVLEYESTIVTELAKSDDPYHWQKLFTDFRVCQGKLNGLIAHAIDRDNEIRQNQCYYYEESIADREIEETALGDDWDEFDDEDDEDESESWK